jgi:hypothetical protein
MLLPFSSQLSHEFFVLRVTELAIVLDEKIRRRKLLLWLRIIIGDHSNLRRRTWGRARGGRGGNDIFKLGFGRCLCLGRWIWYIGFFHVFFNSDYMRFSRWGFGLERIMDNFIFHRLCSSRWAKR